MKNRSISIKALFITKMAYSALFQFLVLGALLLFVKDRLHTQINTFSKNLTIGDSFVLDEVSKYKLLDNQDALDLLLYNIASERKLDSIKFISYPAGVKKYLENCEKNNLSNRFVVCKKKNGQLVGITIIEHDNKAIGYIVAIKQYNPLYTIPAYYGILIILLIVFGIFFFNFLFLLLSMKKKIASDTKYLLDIIALGEITEMNLDKLTVTEYQQIANKFLSEHNKIIHLQKEKSLYEVKKNIAKQVAHDIRSPLAAINTAMLDVTTVTEKRRIMIRNAVTRINDIANNLLYEAKNNDLDTTGILSNKSTTSELIFLLLSNIVAEKKYEYHQSLINIVLHESIDAYHGFSNIHLNSFKRVLSNLMNNSIESIGSEGSVLISLECHPNDIKLIIQDNGCGIPLNILSKVTEQGFSFNKKNGAGFGLSYAKQYVESIAGNIIIDSKENKGTTVTISLPRVNPPNWFCQSINIKSNSVIIILDDDSSIHEAWNERFINIPLIKLIHFYKASELLHYEIDSSAPVLYLIDHELLGDLKNGLDVIEHLKLDNAILVTSCFEDIAVRSRCEKNKIKIIPKAYVPYIEIIQTSTDFLNTLVLIDDDDMMRMAWIFAAENAGAVITTYPSFETFMDEINLYNKNTVIYIDSDLGNNIKGEICAKELFNRGFRELYLTTGYSIGNLSNLPWIKLIIGKEHPFILNRETNYECN